MIAHAFLSGTAVLAAACLVCVIGIVRLRPWLIRYALARPSARGLHTIPTPQGGGIAVLGGCAVGAGIGAVLVPLESGDGARLAAVLATAAALGLLGLIDDIRPLPALPRLLLQLLLMAIGIGVLPAHCRPLPFLPLTFERVLLVIGGTWFINLTNFMDGMDWMTVAEMVPISAALAVLWPLAGLPPVAALLAFGLLGALFGYAPFNKPTAQLFLGDVGSLPIGFLVAYGLISLAGRVGPSGEGLIAAVILPLYYIADSGITLAWRLSRGEKIWEPHRSHFYQMAAARAGPWRVLNSVFAINVTLAGLAVASAATESVALSLIAAVTATIAVTLLLHSLSRETHLV